MVKPHLCKRYGLWSASYLRDGVPMFVIADSFELLAEGVRVRDGLPGLEWTHPRALYFSNEQLTQQFDLALMPAVGGRQ
jgi:hypothetical protein